MNIEMMDVDKKLTFQGRRERIRNMIIDIGVDNINKTQLAKDFGVSRQVIHADINKILADIPPEVLEQEKCKSYYGMINAEKRLMRIIHESREAELQLKAIDIFTRVLERKAKIFELFGLKNTVAKEDIAFEFKVAENKDSLTLDGLRQARKIWEEKFKKE